MIFLANFGIVPVRNTYKMKLPITKSMEDKLQ